MRRVDEGRRLRSAVAGLILALAAPGMAVLGVVIIQLSAGNIHWLNVLAIVISLCGGFGAALLGISLAAIGLRQEGRSRRFGVLAIPVSVAFIVLWIAFVWAHKELLPLLLVGRGC